MMTTGSISFRGCLPLIGQIIGIVMVSIGLYSYRSFLFKKNWVTLIFWSSFVALFLLSSYMTSIFNINLCVTNMKNMIKYGWVVENAANNLNIQGVCVENVDKFIFWIGLSDSIILSILVIATGGLTKSVYSPIFPVIPSAVLIFTINQSNYVLFIIAIILIGIIFSWACYIWPRILYPSFIRVKIIDFWNTHNNDNWRHSVGIVSITFLSSCVILLDALIRILIKE